MYMSENADMFSAACITRYALVEIADKWTILIIAALSERPYYFGELYRKVDGVSKKMLTQTLRRLEKDGLVLRAMQSGNIIKVRYSLTPMGESLTKPLRALQDWVIANAERLQRQLQEACKEEEWANEPQPTLALSSALQLKLEHR